MKKVYALSWCDDNDHFAISESVEKLFEVIISHYSDIKLFWDEGKKTFITFPEKYGENWTDVLKGLDVKSFNNIYEDIICLHVHEIDNF